MTVAIIGGGSSAHLLAVLLSGRGHKVRVMTSRPDEWERDLELKAGREVLRGRIEGATSSPFSAVEDADVAILCMPVHQYPVALANILPAIVRNPKCIVGVVYGQGGFNWMVHDICRRNSTSVFRHFAIGLLPWITRIKQYGRSAISYGPKYRNGIACSDDATFDYLQQNLLDDFSWSYWGTGRFERIPNFFTLTMTVDNQIIHPSRCFALMKGKPVWASKDEVPYFYRDFDDASADVLRGIDADYTTIRSAYFRQFPRLDNPFNLNYLELEHWSYGDHNPDIRASFVHSTTLGEIKPPLAQTPDGMWTIDVNHRFFRDDFAFGLEIAQWFGGQLGCDLPHIDRLVNWFRTEIEPCQEVRQTIRPVMEFREG